MEPRFNKVPRVWENLFVISRVRRYIENPDLTNFLKKKKMFVISRVRYNENPDLTNFLGEKNVRYIEV